VLHLDKSSSFSLIKLNHTQVRHLDKALVALARQLHEVRERHKAKGFAVVSVSEKIMALMSTEDKDEEEVDQFPLVSIPDSQLSADDLHAKRKQKMLKGAHEARLKEKRRKLGLFCLYTRSLLTLPHEARCTCQHQL
jgi:hypothetical protein